MRQAFRRWSSTFSTSSHQDITYVTPPLAASTAQNRLAGFNAATRLAKAAGCRFDVVEARAYDVAEGERIMGHMLASGLTSTAVLAFNDLLAVGCLVALKSAGVACPEQISLAGVNDLLFMNLLSPPLTTLHTAGRDLRIRKRRPADEPDQKSLATGKTHPPHPSSGVKEAVPGRHASLDRVPIFCRLLPNRIP